MKNYSIAIPVGILAGIATIYLIQANFEWIICFILIILGGYLIWKNHSANSLKDSFIIALFIGTSITFTDLFFVKDYLKNHPEEAKQLVEFKINNSERLTLLIIAPIYWLILWLFIYISNWVLQKLFKSNIPE